MNILNAIPDGVYIVSQKHNIEYINPFIEQEFGSIDERKCYEYFHDRTEPCSWCKNNEVFTGKSIRWEWYSFKNDQHYDLFDTPIMNVDGSVSKFEIFHNITERKIAEEAIKASLKEKEILLKEIHHRVKNNMQIITSLANLQLNQMEDKDTMVQFQTFENRIRSMAVVHEMLYHSKDMASINFDEYLDKLIDGIFKSSNINLNNIKPIINVENIYLGLDMAIPCGLLITELITNALKHAFPGDNKGEIKIDIKKDTKGNISLTVKDNGIGIPENMDITNTKSLGFTLLNALVKQLKGEMEITGKKGTEVSITFPGE